MGKQTSTSFQPGVSGNPAGRPPKARALTALLEAAGNTMHPTAEGKRVAGKRLLAAGLWEGIATGKITLPGQTLTLEPGDWLALVKWLYQHIDGPPKAEIDVTSNGETVKFYAGFNPEDV